MVSSPLEISRAADSLLLKGHSTSFTLRIEESARDIKVNMGGGKILQYAADCKIDTLIGIIPSCRRHSLLSLVLICMNDDDRAAEPFD